ncbi:PTS system, N-acetylmuramic acid-specific IIB component or PTS system, N-acetylmuramic acid-specific IIC component [Streptomyces venezuelae]|uniref:PTS transporter subunit EIIC n=1 Tax=Streptomyces gardneri TaxID=66892 RepID=UPI0006BD39A4|nr:PTS transporter subunit EIIC [Streptomyces gardneri]ALO10070.1 PTS system, N-acetylmuramic acid-specific IIB component or PTS system, N-acetylmuramic acid-specific IIC component [Streptomyces venezuelae]QPK47104.1 PTS transporter subunit EIIC [Streptomyces gardneri]WRK38522.1 PTS transporter subunit EIIC [Streptomyces venezuelae]CUM39482.1 PTS system, N-acetylmuramic acid-specific IIB component / PTS system, N-acetylmuramic acid-specific IIC component [Streptomyces venezuelae]
MSTDDKNRAIAAAILPLVGGAENISSVAHCMTRLRLGLRDRSLVQDEALKALPSVMGVVEDDTYQIVLGPGTVARVTPELEALVAEAVPQHTAEELADRGAALKAARKEKNATPFKLFLRRIANIFVPLIPALIGCGIIAGLNGLLINLGWLPGVTPALAAIASGFMALIAVFVGYNTAKEFGGTAILGGAVASIIVFAGVAKIDVFGQTLSPGQGGVLGALGAAVLAVYVEKWCRRWVPESLDVLVTPTLTVLISGLVTVFGLMFVAGEISQAIGDFADWLLANAGAGAGFLLGGLFLPLVMLGLHQALIPIHTTLIEQQGYTVLLPILAMAGAGQVGAAMAVYLKLPRNGSIRRTIKSALPAGFLGVGEPLIYGVSLPLGRPFVTACVGGAFGGGFVGLFSMLGDSVGSTAIGPSGWALFPLLDGNKGLGETIAIYAGGLLVGYAVGFVATYFWGFSRELLEEFDVDTETVTEVTVAAGTPSTTPEPAKV